MNKISCLFLVAISILLFYAEPFAAPAISSVSGNLPSGGTVTISGSGFGTKSPAAPLLWDTFENGTVGNAIQNTNAIIGTWNSGTGSNNVFYTNVTSYGGSGKCARHPFTSSLYNSSLCKSGTFPTLFIDFRRYWPSTNDGASTIYPSNYKPWRLYNDGSESYQVWRGIGCQGGKYDVGSILDNGSYITQGTGDDSPWVKDSWIHYQIIWNEGSVNTANGTLIMLENLVPQQVNKFQNQICRTADDHIGLIRIGHYLDTGSRGCGALNANSVVYTDNVYIDTTWARVEIGNASTYAASKRREIQIPEAWSDSSITIKVNQGSFAVGNTVYLYVMDANGIVNSTGYPITIESGAPAPSAPKNLRIVQ